MKTSMRRWLWAAALAVLTCGAICLLPRRLEERKEKQLISNFWSICLAYNHFYEARGETPADYRSLVEQGFTRLSKIPDSLRQGSEFVNPYTRELMAEVKIGESPVSGSFLVLPAHYREGEKCDIVYIFGFGEQRSPDYEFYLDIDSNGFADPLMFCMGPFSAQTVDGCFSSEPLETALGRAGYTATTATPLPDPPQS